MLGLFLPPKINLFRSFFEVPIFYRFWSVLGGFGESFGRIWEEFWKGLGRVWEGFGDEILKPLAKRGTAGGLRSALKYFRSKHFSTAKKNWPEFSDQKMFR